MAPRLREIVDEYIAVKQVQFSRKGQGPFQYTTGPLKRWIGTDTQFNGKYLERADREVYRAIFGDIPPYILDHLQHLNRYHSSRSSSEFTRVLNRLYDNITGVRHPVTNASPTRAIWTRPKYKERQPRCSASNT